VGFPERAVYYAAALFLLVTIALVFFSTVVSVLRVAGAGAAWDGARGVDGARDVAFRGSRVHPPRRAP